MTDQLDLGEKLRALRENRVGREDLYGLIHDFGNAGFTVAEPDVLGFLKHEEPQIRYVAVNVLAFHWDMLRHRDAFERMMLSDSDEDVRRIAAASLGYVLRESRDARATRLLLQKLRDTAEEGSVREAAYVALLDIWLPEQTRDRLAGWDSEDLKKALIGERDWQSHVDWGLVERIERREVS